ncbi:PAPA-1-domain-containing protein [Aspergillus japonicus CBS 114.51]|uniref:PAPA-1-domain-containing protein n=2 Tax=Aspergillus TaxID=5052 RepID=A0A2V5HSV5_ASPV1|nr:PAPA-1-domain-containing protein [Aspergillus japonicus CBS 114.51]PYI24713.1 PAPA-1-domain-containing protein [Aspergillus violaceofuscus CBS 115571]RAH78345.1 PAPA-1-domain-containing protein [Aspergillus japonicus CBS 114.51]
MPPRRSLRSHGGRNDPPSMIDINDSPRSTRSTRAAAAAAAATAASSTPAVTAVCVPSDVPGESSKRSIHLTVKMPSNKLREVTGGSARGAPATRRSVNVFTENPIITGPRTSRPRKKLVEVDTSDEDDLEDQEEDEVDDEDAPGEDEEDEDEEDGDEDAEEDEDLDAEGDLDMDDAPPQPPVPKRHAKAAAAAAAAAPSAKAVKSVEEKEMEMDDDDDDDDEELSEPDTDAEGEPDDQDESMMVTGNGGEELDEEDEDDEDLDSDGTPTADLTRMTKRQRGNLGNDFLQLPMEPQVKKHLTAEERAMRRAEMARRRKNLSEKRNEEEKMDTINRLLRKQAPKRRGRIPAAEAAENATADQEIQEAYQKPDPTMVRWVSGRAGSRVGVPGEWVGTPAAQVFGAGPGKLVQEV